MSEPEPASAAARRIEIGGDLDRRTAEALALELRRLARQHGLEVTSCEVVPASPPDDEGPASAE